MSFWNFIINIDGKRNYMYKDFKVFNGKNIVNVIYVNIKFWIFLGEYEILWNKLMKIYYSFW